MSFIELDLPDKVFSKHWFIASTNTFWNPDIERAVYMYLSAVTGEVEFLDSQDIFDFYFDTEEDALVARIAYYVKHNKISAGGSIFNIQSEPLFED